MDSRQIDYYKVFQLVQPLLGDPGPVAGSPAWDSLDDQHPQKWASVLWAAIYWCVNEDAREAAIADAGVEIACAAPWAEIAHRRLQRQMWEKSHPWARPGGQVAS